MKRYISLLLAVVILLGAMPVVGVSAEDQQMPTVSVTSDKWRLVPGQTAQLSAVALDVAGAPIAGVTFSYLSMDESIATVNSNGLVTSVNYGVIEVLVRATVGNVVIPKLVRLTAADPSDREDFEMAPGSVPSFFASGSTMAAVSDDAGWNSAMSAKLYDTSTSSAAILRYATETSEALKLVFDVLPKNGAVQFRISNGGRSSANTAFWITLRSNQVQYYDAAAVKWVNLGNSFDSIADKWNSVRVEAAVDGKAEIYINGQFIGAAPRCGGGYGTGATTVMDSVIFECGDAGTTGGLYYVDNLQIGQPSISVTQTFDKLALNETPAALPGCVAHNGAVAKDAPGAAQGKSLMLMGSEGNTAIPGFQYEFASKDKLTLGFDIYLSESSNTVTFQIYSGTKAYSNTAFFLQFNHAYGLRVYNGAWTTVNANAKLIANGWNRVCVEVTTGQNSEAVIYLNDELAARTQTAYNIKDSVNGFYICTGSATQSCYIDNLMVTTPALETFDSLGLNETPATLPGYVDHHGAVAKADPAGQGGKSVYLFDSSGKKAPYFQYEFGSSNVLTLEFDAYLPTANNTITFQIYKNSKAYTSTAFFLQFNYAYGLRVYNGSWSVIAANAKLIANAWNKIRVEITTGESSEAVVYLNDQHVATTRVAYNKKDTVNGFYVYTGSATHSCYIDDLKVTGIYDEGKLTGEKSLLETKMGGLFDIADNTETEGFPANDPYVEEDFSSSGGIYGFTQIPNVLYDPDTDLVYVNYNRHRDTVVDYPYDSTRIYDVETLLNAHSGDQLQDDYEEMVTENTMFFTAMAKLPDGRIFCQNYMTYYLTNTTATTYSWIVDENGDWEQVEGVLTIPRELAIAGPQPTTNWHRYAFSRCMEVLPDGTLLASMYGTYGAIMVESKDEGKTWNYRSTIADSAIGLDQPYINTDGTEITWFEPAVTRCADGSLLCVLRTWRDKPLYQTRSYDDGLTWTKPILMPGLEGKSIYPHLVLLSNGVLAMATGVPGDTIYFSLDGCGYNWDYCITTYSGDTTGNAAIAELDYDEATNTVTLLALGDKGFNNLCLSGVWGRTVKVTRNQIEDPKIAKALVYAEETKLGLGETYQLHVDAVFNAGSALVNSNYTVQWYTLTPTTATVDQTGKVTAENVGTARIQALVTCAGKTVMTNEVTLQISDRNALDSIEVTASKWVMKPGDTGSLTNAAYNSFGQEFVDEITEQEYINGDINKPKFLNSDVTWDFASQNPQVLSVSTNGTYQAVRSGVANLLVTASKGGLTLSRKITVIVESDQWVTESFEGQVLPENCTATDLVILSKNRCWSGSQALYINDNSNTMAPYLLFDLPESDGVIVEFMLYTESNEHSPNFGIGAPRADGFYNYACNTAYVGLLFNPLTGAQGFQAFNGQSWSYSNRSNNIPHQQWNKVRLEVTTDKPSRLFVNDKLLAELPVAAMLDTLNTLYFSTGGAGYTGDAFYIDDVRYMVFN